MKVLNLILLHGFKNYCKKIVFLVYKYQINTQRYWFLKKVRNNKIYEKAVEFLFPRYLLHDEVKSLQLSRQPCFAFPFTCPNYALLDKTMTECLTSVRNDVEEILSDPDCEIDKQIKELKHDFHDSLTDRPDVLKYIERLHTVIRRQQKKLNKFYKKLKDHRFVKKFTTDSKECQTDAEPNAWNAALQDTEKNITDEVKEVAENAMKNTSFVYEPTSGMYYDYNTGYYYNAELRMYYDGNTGQYLEYDEETKSYRYHSTVGSKVVDTNSYHNSKPSQKVRKKKKIYKDRKAKKSKVDEAEEGEITESSVSGSETSESSEEKEAALQECGVGCEPCIRIMVEETNVEKLKVGSLFVVTCKGGTMGREGDHAVLIPDINVSKHHAKFVFDPKTSSYFITDLGSRNGTWLDGERLSAALQESERFEIDHGAVIQIGSTKLLCHVHDGRDTCTLCEPGLAQQAAGVAVWDPGARGGARYPEYREQLQNLRKKFGVDGNQQDVYNLPGYEDRAEMRRLTVGSSHYSEKTQAAAVTELIPQCNKGFKMLSKMGWSEGQKLGKNDSGLVEPVPMLANTGKSGLGMVSAEKVVISKSAKKKQDILKKTQDRYRNIEGPPTTLEEDQDS